MITPQNIVRHELIGLECRIAGSTNKKIEGLKGRVVGETRQTLVLETGGREKAFIKDQCVFSFRIPDAGEGEKPGKAVWVRVDGKLLVARPEDRIKKKLRKW
jgi:ribonuclease P protein subunit POP4